jgi:hypothetical protein
MAKFTRIFSKKRMNSLLVWKDWSRGTCNLVCQLIGTCNSYGRIGEGIIKI